MRETLDAIRSFLQGQGTTLADAVVEDSAIVLRLSGRLRDPVAALQGARQIVQLGGTVRIQVRRLEASTELTSTEPDRWTAEPGPASVLAGLAGREIPDRWTTSDLVGAIGDPAELEGMIAIEENKRRWSDIIETETGRSVWIGPTWGGFLRWLAVRPWNDVLTTLFRHEGALVLVGDWQSEAAEVGPRLLIGGLAFRSDHIILVDSKWPEDVPPQFVRAIDIDLSADLPEGLEQHLARLVGAAAASMIATRDPNGDLRPHLTSTVRWKLPEGGIGTSRRDVEAIVSLVRWVAEEQSKTRLEIARRLSAARIAEPLAGPPREAIIEAADIAFQQVVDESVQRALTTQAELERTFRTFDTEMAGVRSGISDAVDHVVVRVIAGGLATAIAALTSEHVRGLPVLLAAASIAAYLVFAAVWQLRWLSSDVRQRFDAFRSLVEARGFDLGARVDADIDRWRTTMDGRVRAVRVGFLALALAVLVSGAIGASQGKGRPSTQPAEKPPQSSAPATSPPIVTPSATNRSP